MHHVDVRTVWACHYMFAFCPRFISCSLVERTQVFLYFWHQSVALAYKKRTVPFFWDEMGCNKMFCKNTKCQPCYVPKSLYVQIANNGTFRMECEIIARATQIYVFSICFFFRFHTEQRRFFPILDGLTTIMAVWC